MIVEDLFKTVFMLAVIGVVAVFALIVLALAPFALVGVFILVLVGVAAVLVSCLVKWIAAKLRKEKTGD